jgi:DNA-binding NarL/FixJ family response regulator
MIDARLRYTKGQDALKVFAARFPDIARILISSEDERLVIEQARKAGACGFVSKTCSADGVIAILREIMTADAFLPCSFHEGRLPPGKSLTLRQYEVLQLLATGKTNQQVADDLQIAERTVKLHVTALLEHVGASNRTELVARAREVGLI